MSIYSSSSPPNIPLNNSGACCANNNPANILFLLNGFVGSPSVLNKFDAFSNIPVFVAAVPDVLTDGASSAMPSRRPRWHSQLCARGLLGPRQRLSKLAPQLRLRASLSFSL